MTVPIVDSKPAFFSLWEAGAFGNKLRTWRDPIDAYDSHVPIVGFREIGKAGGGKFEIVQRENIVDVAHEWDQEGRAYMVCEAAPDHAGTLQGEVMRAVGGLEATIGRSNGLRMREAVAKGLLRPVRGLAVNVALDAHMDPSSRADLDALLELYPDHVVEFSCYSVDVGDRPGRNTLFWEVRRY